jgi:choline dehydrogenase-like flavoprotein
MSAESGLDSSKERSRRAQPSLSAGRIFSGSELSEDLVLDCDVCVVGSGSGGAWMALELTKQGKRVVLLEEGGYHTKREFDMTEARAFPNLYQEMGNRSTDDLSISMLQGRSVGGGTTVNWCSSFRTPDKVLAHWRDTFGIKSINPEILKSHFEAVEKRLHVAPWPLEAINENNRILWDGLGKLGFERDLIRRNVNGCLNLGYCGMGCPVDAKQSMLVTTIPDAVELGLNVYANVSARTVEYSGRRVTSVRANILDSKTNRPTGKSITVKPKILVASGGAINTPGLLLRSGLDAQGRVGKRTWLHPVVATMALFEQEVKAFSGAPQSVSSHHFIDRGPGTIGFFIEVPPVHPMLASTALLSNGETTQKLLSQLPHVNAMLAITVDGFLPDEEGATVRLREDGRYSINYNFVAAHFEAFQEGMKQMARIQFAAGAKQVMTLHSNPVVMNSESELSKLDAAPYEKLAHKILTAHQMGGCAMGSNPHTSVVSPELRYHELDNLFVVDGSVLPTSLGVNPQETIMGLAHWASKHIGEAE